MSKIPVRNEASSTGIDSYEVYSSDSDQLCEEEEEEGANNRNSSDLYPTSVQTLSDNDENASSSKGNENLPSDLIERLNKLTQNDVLNTPHYSATDFDEDLSENDDDVDDEEYSEGTLETASNSSSTGAASAPNDNSSYSDYSSIPYTTFEEMEYEQKQGERSESKLSSTDVNVKKHKKTSSSNAVLSTLKKRWKGMKKSSAGKSISSISSSYFSGSKEQETLEERQSRISEEWVNCIIPAWKKKGKTSRVRSLIFRGVPVNVRGEVWKCAIGNPLSISEELYIVLKDRATTGRELFERARCDGKSTIDMGDNVAQFDDKGIKMEENERNAHKAINLDLPRTFPELTFFHIKGSSYENSLRDILQCFLYLKPDIGYSQEVKCYLLVHEKFLEEEMPTLYNHFKKHGIESNLYMINWVMSLYCRALSLDLVTRIWDLYVLDGDVAIFRSALGILRLFMNQLLSMKFEEMAYFLSHIPCDQIDPDRLLRNIRSIRVVTKRKFVDLFQHFRLQYP